MQRQVPPRRLHLDTLAPRAKTQVDAPQRKREDRRRGYDLSVFCHQQDHGARWQAHAGVDLANHANFITTDNCVWRP